MKRALASARDELAAAQELRRSDRDNLRTAQQAAKRDIKAAERMADEVTHAARADFEWRIGEMRAKMQADGASSSTRCRFRWRQRRGALMPQGRRGQGCTTRWRLGGDYAHAREGLIDALAEAQRKREYSDC